MATLKLDLMFYFVFVNDSCILQIMHCLNKLSLLEMKAVVSGIQALIIRKLSRHIEDRNLLINVLLLLYLQGREQHWTV